ncbi:hypothetical protein CA85_05870 [Allorhodopirellula solitaria]|uniref:Uncharacterized protein n=1 Tax=Allorhodopirellula solitaria TaxID=2527987 RepID=A0A5C5YKD1_9BACT|nr:hypothetical protein CA85_05870 [Allorhodopirellula solitaria]
MSWKLTQRRGGAETQGNCGELATARQTSPSGARFIRITMYAHLVIVGLTGLAITHDSRSVIWSARWEPILELALFVGLIGLFIFPAIMLITVWRSSLSPSRRIAALAVDGGITCVHFLALLPSVQ